MFSMSGLGLGESTVSRRGCWKPIRDTTIAFNLLLTAAILVYLYGPFRAVEAPDSGRRTD